MGGRLINTLPNASQRRRCPGCRRKMISLPGGSRMSRQLICSTVERRVKEEKGEEKRIGILTESLGLGAKDVVSLAGAGGKTTLMFRLASELLLGGKKVITTTTTRILEPTSTETPSFFVHPDGERIKRVSAKASRSVSSHYGCRGETRCRKGKRDFSGFDHRSVGIIDM